MAIFYHAHFDLRVPSHPDFVSHNVILNTVFIAAMSRKWLHLAAHLTHSTLFDVLSLNLLAFRFRIMLSDS